MTEQPHPTLVSSALPGDGVFDPPEAYQRYDEILGRDGEMHPVPRGRPLSLTMPVPTGATLWFDEGMPWGESHRAARCTGSGPYLLELGSRLAYAHAAGSVVRVSDD